MPTAFKKPFSFIPRVKTLGNNIGRAYGTKMWQCGNIAINAVGMTEMLNGNLFPVW